MGKPGPQRGPQPGPQPGPRRGPQPRPEQPPAPRPVLTAVTLMYAGAALSVVELVLVLATAGNLRAAIQQAYPHYSASRVHGIEMSYVTSAAVAQIVATGLWVFLAWANRGGRSWARIAASALFALNSLQLVYVFRQPSVSLGLAVYVATWLVGLGAVALLWRRESSDFYLDCAARRSS